MKRTRHPSSSEDSDNGSNSTSWSQHSKSHPRRVKGKKPSEVFRTDLITAMKVHDSYQLNLEDFYILADPWRQEWEKGVQVPVSPESIPQPVARVIADKGKEVLFTKPKKLIRTSGSEALGYVDIITLANGMCRYDLNEEDVAWLQLVNEEFCEMGMPVLDEMTMERVMEEFERRCYDNMSHAMETEEGLGIEYDEDVVCDVCQSPDGEDNNEMVFCDKCNICVHQACYGIQKVPEGSWLCRICALGIVPKCQLCPKKGGAMKPTRSGTKWVHVSCALWIPEVSIGNPEKMEPITNVSHIPTNRWALICCLCKEKTGACIQCSAKNCRTAFHVTCGLHCSLEMNTILTEEDEVKFKSYCPKHSGLEGSEGRDADSGDEVEEEEEGAKDKRSRRRGRIRGITDKAIPATLPAEGPKEPEGLNGCQQEEKRVNLRKLKLQQLEEEFFQFVDAGEVAEHLKLSKEAVDFLYQYWKLKRKANFNQLLLTPKKDEEESLARREQEVLRRRLQLFTHLRQDLERVRNLTYMVTRREKMKRSLWRVQEQIFHHQVRLLEQELLSGEVSTTSVKDISSLSLVPARGSVTKRGSLKKDRKKGGHRKSVVNVPPNHGEGEDPKRPLENEDKVVGHARLQQPKAEEVVNCIRPHKPEEGRSVGRGGPFPDLQQRRVSVVLTRLKPGNDLYTEDRKKKSGLEETSPVKTKTRPGTSAEDSLDGASRTQPTRVSTTTRPNGWLRKDPCTQANGSLLSGGAAGSHLKNWGKFRIPKRTGRPLEVREQEVSEPAAQQRKPLLRPLTSTSEPSYPRTRLRTGTESNVKPSSPEEKKPCVKRCHSHQLRGGDSLCRHYCSDIIRRGVLAS